MSPLVVAAALGAGGLAAVVRFGVSVGLARASKAEAFPWTVLVVNVVGSGLGGAVLGLTQGAGVTAELQLVILTGVCGGLTTFSTFSVETIQLITQGRWRSAVLSVGLNLLVGLCACVLGYALAL
jgi:CrcB protein